MMMMMSLYRRLLIEWLHIGESVDTSRELHRMLVYATTIYLVLLDPAKLAKPTGR